MSRKTVINIKTISLHPANEVPEEKYMPLIVAQPINKLHTTTKNFLRKTTKTGANMELKHIAKDLFVLRHLEFYRQTKSHPVAMRHLFTDRKITEIENEDWYANEYSKKNKYDAYIAHVLGTEKELGIVELIIDSLYHGTIKLDVNVIPEFDDDMKLYSTIVKAATVQALKPNEDDYSFRKLYMQLFTTDKARIERLVKIGFTKEAILKEHVVKGGKPKNVCQLYITKNTVDAFLKRKTK